MPKVNSTTAPATPAEFRTAVRKGLRRTHILSKPAFKFGRVRRFEGKSFQPAGTVSFAAEVDVTIDGKTERYIATSIRYGDNGSGTVEADLAGGRAVWA